MSGINTKEPSLVRVPFKPKQKFEIKIFKDANNTPQPNPLAIENPGFEGNLAYNLTTRINNKFTGLLESDIDESDIDYIYMSGYCYFGSEILIVHADSETQFVHEKLGEYDDYRLGSFSSNLYASMGLNGSESMSFERKGEWVRHNCLYDFIELVANTLSLESIVSAKDSFTYDNFIIIKL